MHYRNNEKRRRCCWVEGCRTEFEFEQEGEVGEVDLFWMGFLVLFQFTALVSKAISLFRSYQNC